MQILIELRKHEDKDYTVHIYEGIKIIPVLSIKKPVHWNKCVTAIGSYLLAKKMINVFQKKSLETKLMELDQIGEKQQC